MKYDQPVWQIMHRCADEMPAVFRYEDVRDWFALHFGEVNEATIRAHLIGLTDGGRAKHAQFAHRSPIFIRVARGEYSAISTAERGESPDSTPTPVTGTKLIPRRAAPSSHLFQVADSAHAKVVADGNQTGDDGDEQSDAPMPDVILLGTVGDRVNVPAPAREMFRDVAFQRRRLDAELSGAEWFILSAEHGLIAPNEWISPDSRTLADLDPDYRVAWAHWVVARLHSIVGSLDGKTVRVDAPDAYVGPLFADLRDVGAIVSSGAVALPTAPSRGPVAVPAPRHDP